MQYGGRTAARLKPYRRSSTLSKIRHKSTIMRIRFVRDDLQSKILVDIMVYVTTPSSPNTAAMGIWECWFTYKVMSTSTVWHQSLTIHIRPLGSNNHDCHRHRLLLFLHCHFHNCRLPQYLSRMSTDIFVDFAGRLSALLPPISQVPWTLSSKMHVLVWSIPVVHWEHPSGRPEMSWEVW